MIKNKKSRKNNDNNEQLRGILDNYSDKSSTKDNKYLDSLQKRLEKKQDNYRIIRKQVQSVKPQEVDPLKPKVTVYSRKEEKTEIKKEEVLPSIVQKPKIESVKQIEETTGIIDDDFFEVDKKYYNEPRFSQVVQKEKQLIPEDKTVDEIPTWEEVPEEEVQVKEHFDEETLEIKKEALKCKVCGACIISDSVFCTECGNSLEKGEEIPEFKEVKEEKNNPGNVPNEENWEEVVEEKEEIPSWEPVIEEQIAEPEKVAEEVEDLVDKHAKIDAFKEVKSIDDETAILLFDNGITTVDSLKSTTVQDLKKIKGIKRKKAKEIINELNQELEWHVEEVETTDIVEKKPTDLLEKPVLALITCPKCGVTFDEDILFCSYCGEKIIENKQEKIEEPASWEPEEEITESITEEDAEDVIEKQHKIDTYKDITSIDDESAIILYNAGYTSIDSLKDASVKELSDISTIKKRQIKKIKKEVDELVDMEDIKVEPISVGESAEIELTEEQIKEEPTISDNEKIEPFNELENIDDKTAILLFDNGITTIDSLKTTPYEDITKIKGIKKRQIKKILKEIDEKEQEAVELKAIDLGETAEGELSKEDIEKYVDLEDNSHEPSPVELHDKESEWEPVEKDEIDEDDSEPTVTDDPKQGIVEDETSEFLLEEIPEDEKEIESIVTFDENLDPFKDFETIDHETAIKFYNSGITTVGKLKALNIKELTKIKGIRKKVAKKIVKEIEEKSNNVNTTLVADDDSFGEYFLEEEAKKDTGSESIDESIMQYNSIDEEEEQFFDEEIKDNEEKSLDKKIMKHNSESPVEESFIEDETVEELPDLKDSVDENPFSTIESINGKTSQILLQNGIDSVEKLKNMTIKDLTKIRGIRKKFAKNIKQEVKYIPSEKDQEEPSFDPDENPFLQESLENEQGDWESFEKPDETESISKKFKGFVYEEYTLFEKEVKMKSGGKRTIRFFSKAQPDDAIPINIPKGFQVKKNKKTGVPYLKKKK